MEALRGHTTGFAVPQYVIDTPGGGGKVPVARNTFSPTTGNASSFATTKAKFSSTQRYSTTEASPPRRVPPRNRDMQPAAKLNQIGVAWNWQYDPDFIHLLDRSFHQAGLDSYLVGRIISRRRPAKLNAMSADLSGSLIVPATTTRSF